MANNGDAIILNQNTTNDNSEIIDTSRWYDDQDILNYVDLIIQHELGNYRRNLHFLLAGIGDGCFPDDDGNRYLVAVTPAIDTASYSAPIDIWLDKSKQVSPDVGRVDDRRDVWDELMPILSQQATCHTKILFGYNDTRVHWLTGEIQIHKNNHDYQIILMTHNPYGQGTLLQSNSKCLCAAIEKGIKQQDAQATFNFIRQQSPYGRRQMKGDGDSCGVITATDIVKRITGASLNQAAPYPAGAETVRKKHIQDFKKYLVDDNPTRTNFIKRNTLSTCRAKESPSQPSSHAEESAVNMAQVIRLLMRMQNKALQERILTALSEKISKDEEETYLVGVQTAIQQWPAVLMSQGVVLSVEDIVSINELYYQLFLDKTGFQGNASLISQIDSNLKKQATQNNTSTLETTVQMSKTETVQASADDPFEDNETTFGQRKTIQKNILLLGKSRAGKSTIANLIMGVGDKGSFKRTIFSETCMPIIHENIIPGVKNDYQVRIIDIPGIVDSRKPIGHISPIIKILAENKVKNFEVIYIISLPTGINSASDLAVINSCFFSLKQLSSLNLQRFILLLNECPYGITNKIKKDLIKDIREHIQLKDFDYSNDVLFMGDLSIPDFFPKEKSEEIIKKARDELLNSIIKEPLLSPSKVLSMNYYKLLSQLLQINSELLKKIMSHSMNLILGKGCLMETSPNLPTVALLQQPNKSSGPLQLSKDSIDKLFLLDNIETTNLVKTYVHEKNTRIHSWLQVKKTSKPNFNPSIWKKWRGDSDYFMYTTMSFSISYGEFSTFKSIFSSSEFKGFETLVHWLLTEYSLQSDCEQSLSNFFDLSSINDAHPRPGPNKVFPLLHDKDKDYLLKVLLSSNQNFITDLATDLLSIHTKTKEFIEKYINLSKDDRIDFLVSLSEQQTEELLIAIREIVPEITVESTIIYEKCLATLRLERYDDRGFSAIHRACFSGNLVKVQQLVEVGAELTKLTRKGASILDLAIEQKNALIIKWLLQKNVNLKQKQAADLGPYIVHPDIELVLLVLQRLYPKYQEAVDYILTHLDLKSITENMAEQALIKQFLSLSFYANNALHTVFIHLEKQKKPTLIMTLKSHYPIYFFAALKNNLFESQDWSICLERIQTYSLTNTQHVEAIRFYINNAITEAVLQWQDIFPDKKNISLPQGQVNQPKNEKVIYTPQQSKHNLPAVNQPTDNHNYDSLATPPTYPSFPVADLVTLLLFTQQLGVDKLLENTEQAKKNDSSSLKRWFIERFIMKPTDIGYDTLLANLNVSVVTKILKTAYGKFQILATLRNRDIFNWKALTGTEAIFAAIDSLKNYLNSFRGKDADQPTLQHEMLVVSLLKDHTFHEFLTSSKLNIARSQLIALCVSAKIPGLDESTVISGFSLLSDLQKSIFSLSATTQAKIISYQSLALNLLEKDMLKVADILKRSLDFITQLQKLIQIFLQPQLIPLSYLLQPALQQTLTKAKSLSQQLENNPLMKDTALMRQLPFTKNEVFINTNKLLEEMILSENLGPFLRSPTGTALVNKQWVACVFISSNDSKEEKSSSEDLSSTIRGSFKKMAFIDYHFQQCIFRGFSFAQAYLSNCDFTGAVFSGEIDVTGTLIDAATVNSLLLAWQRSRDQQTLEPSQALCIKGKLILFGESKTILDIYGEWADYVDIQRNNISWVRMHKMNFVAPVFAEPLAPSQDPVINQPMDDQDVNNSSEQPAYWSGMLGGLSNFLPNLETLNKANHQVYQAVTSICGYMKQPITRLSSFHKTTQEEAIQVEKSEAGLQDALRVLKHKQKDLKQQQTEALETKFEELAMHLKQNTNINVQAISLVATQQDTLREQIEQNQTAITILQNEMSDIQIYWQQKKQIALEQQRILTAVNPAIKVYYQTLLTQLSGAFLALFLLQNNLQLIKTETGKITDLASKGGVLSATQSGNQALQSKAQEHLGFLGKITENNPLIIAKAFQGLEYGVDNILSYSKKILKLKSAVKMIPAVGEMVASCLTIVESSVDFVLDKKDQSKLNRVEQRWQGLTPKTLEKLADAIARRMTLAYLQSISLLSIEGAKVLAQSGMMRIIVALLNQQLGQGKDFTLGVLIAVRSFDISQNNYFGLPNLFGFNWLRRPLELSMRQTSAKITEDDIYRRSGICYKYKLTNDIYYYSNDGSKNQGKPPKPKSIETKANVVGYMEVTQSEWEEFFLLDVTPDDGPLKPAQQALQSQATEAKIENKPNSPTSKKTGSDYHVKTRRVEDLEQKNAENIEQIKKLEKKLAELEQKIPTGNASPWQSNHSAIANFGNAFSVGRDDLYKEKLKFIKEAFLIHNIAKVQFQLERVEKTITIKIEPEKEAQAAKLYNVIADSLYHCLGSSIIKDFDIKEDSLTLKIKTTEYAKKIIQLLEQSGLQTKENQNANNDNLGYS